MPRCIDQYLKKHLSKALKGYKFVFLNGLGYKYWINIKSNEKIEITNYIEIENVFFEISNEVINYLNLNEVKPKELVEALERLGL